MLKLDHVVYFTEKTPKEMAAEQRLAGQHAVIGGRHEKWGTHNALMYVKNAYVEWLSVENKEIAERANHQLTKQLLNDVEGWGTICLSIEGIEEFNEKIKRKGIPTSGVLEAERKTVDGKIRKWKMLFVEQQLSDKLPMPFFIEWEDADEVRFEQLRGDGTITPANEKNEIQECIFSVDDPLKEVTKWAGLLSIDVKDENSIVLSNVVLKFIRKRVDHKERLSDVLMGQV